jgi:hypothetical protein
MKFDARFQAAIAIMLAANLLAFAVAGASLTYFVVSVVSFTGLWLVFEKIIQMAKRRAQTSSVAQEARLIEQEVFAMPIEEARQRAENAMSDPKRFARVISSAAFLELAKHGITAAGLVDFFSKYDSVRTLNGDMRISRKSVEDSAMRPGYVRIGTDFFGETELVVTRQDETVYETDGSESSEKDMTAYPSIFHLIVVKDRMLDERK